MQPPLMIPPMSRPAAERPHRRYKRRLLEEILELAPASLLEVGCGAGGLLADVQAHGVAVAGVEPEPTARELAGARGLDVHAARAEALPFPDASFDLVVFDYTAHHVERLGRALGEAARVARRGVLVLDSWYDDALPCQRVARAYDEWLKRIDRRLGFVHNPSIEASEFVRMLAAAAEFEARYGYELVLTALPLGPLEANARDRLAQIGSPPDLASELDRILDAARQHGLSDDGCLLFRGFRPA
ncbi:SAM-dependent methyltransferase [Phenylobacterium zucineum HLK1]|uniref:SAM-dependent methyltransferase n=2 Tax=Phenylobacterium zucineum TaxID=284016 RepID=B4R9V0_PHEZH|nr:SAM-dependent methyltransferase [Phenylobacterium zucineum HLK1]